MVPLAKTFDAARFSKTLISPGIFEASKTKRGVKVWLISTTYYLAYFLPEGICFMTIIMGWDTLPFLDAQEFL